MKKVLIQTSIGLLLLISGIYTIYVFVMGIDEGSSILILGLSLILIIAGLYFLMHAGESDDTVISKLKNLGRYKKIDKDAGFEKVLERNNELSKAWGDTVEKRDKLKMLEISAAAEETTT